MKTFLSKYYAHLIIFSLILFSGIGAWYSTPMQPDIEIEFQGSIRKDIHKPQAPPEPVKNRRVDI